METPVNKPLPAPTEEAQLRALLAAMEASNQGDFTHRLPVYGTHPLIDRLAEAFNTGVTLNATLTQQLVRVEEGVSREGRASERVSLGPVSGGWAASEHAINALLGGLATFASELARVAREVGTEGRLGSQASGQGLSGLWKELTDAVNGLVGSLAMQIRDLARVATAVAKGELTEKITVDAEGEMLTLKNTVNTMVDKLSAFSAEVTRVAKEVGTEGMLSHQPDRQGVSGVWKDLSENVTVTEQLALASKHKSEFLANMSHELRTPLNSLLILAKVLSENKERRLSPKEVEYAKTIHTSGTDLLSLINEILDLSKVEAGKMQVEPSDVLLADVKEFVERTFQHVAQQKGLGFSVNLGAELPAAIHTDARRLQQVLKNLLANAFKFTGSGRVELRVSRVDTQRMHFESERLHLAGRVLAFSVVDSGIGIPKDKQKLIFEAFQQAEGTTTTSKYGGTGLGLSISRAMAHLLGGELHVDSQPGQGSTFTLYLPEKYTRPDGSTSENSAPTPEHGGAPGQDLLALPRLTPVKPGPQLAGRRVLLVDDDIRNVFALTSSLENQGVEVLHAENGKVGLETLRAHPDVDAVLMDMMMPEMNGYEALRAIRQDARFATLPLIAITANVMKEDREKCLAAGASDYLPKPVDTDRLIELLRRWCLQPR